MATRNRPDGGDKAMHEINDRLLRLLEQAPSDATAEIGVQKVRRGYKGYLKVFSRQRRFVGASKSDKFYDLIDRIFLDVQAQILQWKQDRRRQIGEVTR